MFYFIKTAVSKIIPWKSSPAVKDTDEEEKKIINSINSVMDVNTESEDILEIKRKAKSCEQSDTVKFDFETFKCSHKSGRITHLCDDYGVIDDVTYFEPSQVLSGLNLKENDEVLYSSYKVKENEADRVYKIYALKNDAWGCSDKSEDEPDSKKSQEICALSRVINGRVTRRKGREVYIESANIWCHLDKVQTDYIPVKGDWVELQAVVSISDESVNLMGDILEVKSLKPLLKKCGSGRITYWCDSKKEGAIENLIYFTILSCEEGYIPSLGDEVVYDAVESDQESFRWRAVKVLFSSTSNIKKNLYDDSRNDSLSKTSSDLFYDKNGISIIPAVCTVEIECNQKKTVTIEVINHGNTEQLITHTKFHRKRNSQLQLLSPENTNNLRVPSKQSIQFEFRCSGNVLGLTGEIFYFYFKDFLIAKRFEITVIGSKDMNKFLECKFDTIFKVFNRKKCILNNIESDEVLFGPKPWKTPKFVSKERKCVFNIPQKLWHIAGNTNNGLKTIKALTDYAPYLKTDLDFDHYSDRFHTLLFLEEIELKINFKKYDMNEVYLTRKDDYFVLEVPGLVEKRPSIIVGDKVVLTQSWCDSGKIKHIGYIHYIRAKEIYIKFHGSFHDSYKETECNVSFEPSTSFFSKCHQVVNRAIKTLGQEWLFPSAVNEKPPAVDFRISEKEILANERNLSGKFSSLNHISKHQTVKKSVTSNVVHETKIESNMGNDSNSVNTNLTKKNLVWINKNLNERQKLAVANVLEGKGRPLPYIIFGPPGTGKTVTLVEIIIQIYRMVPESRILITTPSNSSADLICERLIEMGKFKPGQLVRLVALYRVIEGLVPFKLIPYTTFYNPKENVKDLSKLNMKDSKIKGLSSNEFFGRQKITVATCVTIGFLHYLNLPPGHFTHILIDEAGQTSEPEILISATFQNTRTGQVILTGDPQQLGPVVCSSLAKNFGFGVSLLQRLISRFPYARDFDGFPTTSGFDPRFITKLNVNYRTVPEILSLPSQLFYNSDLVPTVSQTEGEEAEIIEKFNCEIDSRKTPPALIFHGIIGQNYQEKDSPSWFNPHEIWQVIFYLKKLYCIGLKSEDIGIVSPYAKQVQKLKMLLLSLNLPVPKVGSVEEFQGQERAVIIVSTVRSTPKFVSSDITHSLGFVASPQRLNVALTRARALLIIVGNPILLSKDPYWVSVVNYCLKINTYIGCSLNTFEKKMILDKNLKKEKEKVDPKD